MRYTLFFAALSLVACAQAQPPAADHARARHGALSPSAPVELTYQREPAVAGQPRRVDVAIDTRLRSGTLLVEVARQEGAALLGASTYRFDLSQTPLPLALQLQATLFGTGEHYLVLLLTVDTPMGPMSRSFRIDLISTAAGATL